MTDALPPLDRAAPPQRVDRTALIVTALDVELAPIVAELGLRRDRAGAAYRGQLGPVAVVAAVAGVGHPRATVAFEQLVSLHRPDVAVLAGFAGALDGSLKRGYLFVPHQVVRDHGAAISLGSPEPPQAMRTLVTVDHCVTEAEARAELHQRHRAQAVDMETYHVAQCAAECGVRLIVVRAISDDLDAVVPTWAADLISECGVTRRIQVLRTLARRPGRLGALLRLRRDATLAGAVLAVSVGAKLAAWAAEPPPQAPSE